MLNKVALNGTYGYENFISDDEKTYLVEWCNKNFKYFKENEKGKGRYFITLNQVNNSPLELVKELKDRIIKLENIVDWIEEPLFSDYIGINTRNGEIHPHRDPNVGKYIHTRYNIILSWPDNGGESIYENNINVLYENLIWKCIAGKVKHASKPVLGDKPRITLSLGFLINDHKVSII